MEKNTISDKNKNMFPTSLNSKLLVNSQFPSMLVKMKLIT